MGRRQPRPSDTLLGRPQSVPFRQRLPGRGGHRPSRRNADQSFARPRRDAFHQVGTNSRHRTGLCAHGL